jgi:hypothetical protein
MIWPSVNDRRPRAGGLGTGLAELYHYLSIALRRDPLDRPRDFAFRAQAEVSEPNALRRGEGFVKHLLVGDC